ncbi:PLC-like phosphodiesterase, partial [Polyplosphaeria fusca]
RPRIPSPSPSFVRLTAAISIPSSRNSPASTPSYFGTNGSLQSTPEGMHPVSHPSLPAPPSLNLTESLFPPHMSSPTSSPSAMAEALTKGPGLIRRVSRGAQGIPNKLRRNGSNALRDRSSGPVIMRRRGDSTTAADGVIDISDLDLDLDEEDEEAVDDDREPVDALGISSSRPSVSSIPDSTVTGPVRSARLEQGTWLTKATKKKKAKEVCLRLDFYNARVSWDESRPSKCFYVDDVKEIRTGNDARHYRDENGYGENCAPRWLTIVYSDTSRSKGKIKTMNLICPNVGIFELWTRSLDGVSRSRIEMMSGLSGTVQKSANLVWQREMTRRFKGAHHREEDEAIEFDGVKELCRSLHINCHESKLTEYFCLSDRDRTGSLNKAQFLRFVKKLKERKDLKNIFEKMLPPEQSQLDRETFFSFLEREQAVNVKGDFENWTTVFERFARSSKPKAAAPDAGDIPPPLTMSFRAFQYFMTSDLNSAFLPPDSHMRLDRPLNEYFISSSHNTYLPGRQIAGHSSTEAYIYALQKGCRCVEIDCWDGGDGKPVVTHGRTFTKSIPFLDTIKVINTYAFCGSSYPLILSLEVHCGAEQQDQMAKMMKEEFGDKLLLYPLEADSATLPSPEQLRGKVLVKVKAPAEEFDSRFLASEPTGRKRERSFSSPWSRPTQVGNDVIPDLPLISSPSSMSPPERVTSFWSSPRTSTTSTNATVPTPVLASSAEDSDGPLAIVSDDKKKKSKTSKITKQLGELGVYTRGYKFDDFNGREAHAYNHVFSFSERTFDRLTKPQSTTKQALEAHNMRSLMRVYPGATRIGSSNFEPLKFWRRGVQMVASNWQTYDLGQQLNEAMFAGGNDRTGYVLKPAELRMEEPTPVIGPTRAPKQRVKFAVEIISAQQLPRPKGLSPTANINPYVEFEMHCAEDMGPNADSKGGQDASAPNGHSGIGNPVKKRTGIAVGNGYNPMFQNKIIMTVTTRFPSLVFVRWTVWNSEDARSQAVHPLATFTAKLDNLKEGYRHLPLFDANGEQYLFSTLFCRIEKIENDTAPIETIDEKTGSRRASVISTAGALDTSNLQSGRSFLKSLLRRSSSDRKKRKDQRSGNESKEPDSDTFSRASTL